MGRIVSHNYSIQDAFRECVYIVPDYQREYVWTDKQVTQLLNDIDEQLYNGDAEYFIGTILVSANNHSPNHYDVIDGQQRLTTTFLILCALRVLFEGEPQAAMIENLITSTYMDSRGDVKTTLKLEPRYENAGEVIHKLVETKAGPQTVRNQIQASGIPIFGSVENILNAYDTIFEFLTGNYDSADKLKAYGAYLAQNLVLIQISTNVSSALKIFETINERGVGLNPMDLLKNLLFTQVTPDEFSNLKDQWKRVTGPLEKHKEKPLRFLRYFLMANYSIKNKRNDAIVREDEIYDWFSNKENAALAGYKESPFEFVRKVIRNVEYYISFSQGQGNDGTPNLAMDSLKRLTGGAFSLHYVLLLAASNLPKPLFDHFVAQLESFLFYYIFTKTPTKDLERNFSIWADELRDIAAMEQNPGQVEKLNAFVQRHFVENMTNKTAELSDALKRLTFHSMQQYRTRYFLARISQHVDMAYSGQKQRSSLDPYYKLEIEHILPQGPELDLLQDWQTKNPDSDYEEAVIQMGNLTLLEKPINIVASNDYYENKIAEYANSGTYLTRSLSGLAEVGQNTSISRINEQLSSFETWNRDDITKRQSILIALAQDVWKTTELAA